MGRTLQWDDSRWPLVVIRFIGDVDEHEFDDCLAFLDRNMERALSERTKTTIIFDARMGERASPTIRRKQADWMKRNAASTKLGCAGLAFVITSALVRGILTAILWLTDMSAPYTIVGTATEAEEWCLTRLSAHGVKLPAKAASS